MASQNYYTNLPFAKPPELMNTPEFITEDFQDFSNAGSYDQLMASGFNEDLVVFGSETDIDSSGYCSSFSDNFEIPAMEAMDSSFCISNDCFGQFLQEPLLPNPTSGFRAPAAGVCSSGEGIWQPVTDFRGKIDGFVSDCGRFSITHNQAIQGNSLPSIEESGLRVGRYTMEEKKERIRRYMRKRNQRNFNKTIKYACRKTLADSRPRVRGRFARNDELGEVVRRKGGQHQWEGEENNAKIKQEDEDWLQWAVAALMYFPISAE